MTGMADQDDGIVLPGEPYRFQVNFCDKRASGVYYLQVACFGLATYGRRYTVCTEDHPGAFWHLTQFVHENRSSLAQFIHNMPVVNDLFAYVNRRSIEI